LKEYGNRVLGHLILPRRVFTTDIITSVVSGAAGGVAGVAANEAFKALKADKEKEK